MVKLFQSVLSVLLGLFFILAGGKKLMGQEAQIDSFFRWGYPLWFLYLIGSLELASGVCLLFPQVRTLGLIVLSITMVGASLTHFRSGEFSAVPIPLILLVLLLILVWMMRSSSRKDRSRTDFPS